MQRDSIHQTDTQIYIQEVNSTAAQVETKACIGKWEYVQSEHGKSLLMLLFVSSRAENVNI